MAAFRHASQGVTVRNFWLWAVQTKKKNMSWSDGYNREVKQTTTTTTTTTTTRTSLNKRFNEQNNSCARAL